MLELEVIDIKGEELLFTYIFQLGVCNQFCWGFIYHIG